MEPNSPNHPSESKREERRQYSRTKVAVAVELQPDKASTPLRVKTADLSIGGLYVEMMFTLEVGTKLKIVLWINDVKVSTGGVVVTRDLQVGNGIDFTDIAPEDRVRLEQFLAVAGNATRIKGKKNLEKALSHPTFPFKSHSESEDPNLPKKAAHYPSTQNSWPAPGEIQCVHKTHRSMDVQDCPFVRAIANLATERRRPPRATVAKTVALWGWSQYQ